ncbi:MAG TPA: S53 family peptidase [Terriglobia bacterium]|nr:S53 family peptidase [Terriglobia bacterium]
MLCKYYRLLPILALTLGVWTAGIANAQGMEPVHPLLDVQGKGGKNVVGLTPAQIKHAYGFDRINNEGKGQTIAIIDAFDHPSVEKDLAKFNNQFNLPDCTTENGCFTKVFACGSAKCDTNPGTNDPNYQSWALEIALDVEWAHAIAPKANIVLVEAAAGTLDVLLGAVDVAVNPPYSADVVSMSWGGPEFQSETGPEDAHFVKRRVTFFAGAGDFGNSFGTLYPAASPYVMAIGGTRLTIDQSGNYVSEKAWSGVDGGISPYETEPGYQVDYGIPSDPQGKKGIPDVAFDGAPGTGVAVYDSVGDFGWLQIGGTSIGPPQWSGLVAIANSLRAKDNKPALTGSHGVLYQAAQDSDGNETYHDISSGRDGNCGTLCKAKPGYDFVTGLGTPRADLLIPALRNLDDR